MTTDPTPTTETRRTTVVTPATHPDTPIGQRMFYLALDETTLDEVRSLLGWIVGGPDLREGTSALYFAAGEALGYRDDPKMFRSEHANLPPSIRRVEGQRIPLEDRR